VRADLTAALVAEVALKTDVAAGRAEVGRLEGRLSTVEEELTRSRAEEGGLREAVAAAEGEARALEGTLTAAREETRNAEVRVTQAEDEVRIALALRVPAQTPVKGGAAPQTPSPTAPPAASSWLGEALAGGAPIRESDLYLPPSPAVPSDTPTPELVTSPTLAQAQVHARVTEEEEEDGSEFAGITRGGLTTPLKRPLARHYGRIDGGHQGPGSSRGGDDVSAYSILQRRNAAAVQTALDTLRGEYSAQVTPSL